MVDNFAHADLHPGNILVRPAARLEHGRSQQDGE